MSRKKKQRFLGVDLGGSKILTAVIDTQGKILSRDYRSTQAEKGAEVVIRAILNSAGSAVKQAGMDIKKIDAIGIGAAGFSNPETGVVFSSPNLPDWHNVPLRDIIEREAGRKTFLTNDAKAAALGELHFGAARGARNFIYITLSTGIGGGIVINGELYTGAIGTAGEIGHMTIEVNGPRCNCGNTGCWEALASGSALAQQAVQRIKQGTQTSILNYAEGDLGKVTAQVIQAAAEQGDSLAKELIIQTGYYIGVGLANLINIFNPELIVIGGGLANIGDTLLKPAYKVARERAHEEAYQAVRFTLAKLGGNSGVIGATIFAFKQMKKLNS
jgi:glucokinase